jgi:hypothetical protein
MGEFIFFLLLENVNAKKSLIKSKFVGKNEYIAN